MGERWYEQGDRSSPEAWFMREIPQCWLTGRAAGVAAALAVASGRRPGEVDVGELQGELLAQGAYLQVAVT